MLQLEDVINVMIYFPIVASKNCVIFMLNHVTMRMIPTAKSHNFQGLNHQPGIELT